MEDPVPQENFSIQHSDKDKLLDSAGSNGVNLEITEVTDPIVGICTRLESYGNEGFKYKVYTRRWYILTVFALLNALQCITWNTWGPIADTSKIVLNWTDGDIALLTNWGPIAYISTGLLFSWVLDVKGLKISVVAAAVVMLIGLGVRCIPVGIENIKWTMNIGQIFIGLGGPLVNAAPTVLSAVWFPPHQRTTATAISTASISMGVAVSFLIGPQIVTGIETGINSTNIDPAINKSFHHWSANNMAIDPATRKRHYLEIMLLMYIECGAGAFLALCTVAYFPSKPPSPPSASAATLRESFKDGAIHLAKNAQFWILGLAYSVSAGIYSAWVTQLDTLFQHADGVGQETVGWIGFYSNIAAMLACLIFARFVDCFGGYMKKVLLLLITLATISCLWCVLLSLKFIPFHIEFLYISCISLGFFLPGCAPIFFEITVEGVYPVAEGITTMVLTLMNNVMCLVFLLLSLIPQIGVDWMNWAVLAATGVAIPLLLLYRESYNRLKCDKHDASQSVNADLKGI